MNCSEINIRDPFVLVVNETYYLYGTRGPTCWGEADGFDVYTSQDLINWSEPTACFHNDGSFWADREYWAPEVHIWKEKFYMFASFHSETTMRGTAILVSDSPMGPFKPYSAGCITPSQWECLDGTFFVSDDGKPYIVFCHEWTQVGNGEVWAMQLTDDLKSPANNPFLLFRAQDVPWSISISNSNGQTGYVTDGPFIWRLQSGELLCLWSSISKNGYVQAIAKSCNNDITGQFEQLEPLFWEDGGHGMVFCAKDGKLYLALHSPNKFLLERPTFINLIEDAGQLRLNRK